MLRVLYSFNKIMFFIFISYFGDYLVIHTAPFPYLEVVIRASVVIICEADSFS